MAWLIRLYDKTGRLLYIAGSTATRPGTRLRTLRTQKAVWWNLVDEDKILTDQITGDLRVEVARAITEERPKYYWDSNNRQPYRRVRPAGSDYARRLLASGPLSRINRRRAE
jgi:hypothetical protein